MRWWWQPAEAQQSNMGEYKPKLTAKTAPCHTPSKTMQCNEQCSQNRPNRMNTLMANSVQRPQIHFHHIEVSEREKEKDNINSILEYSALKCLWFLSKDSRTFTVRLNIEISMYTNQFRMVRQKKKRRCKQKENTHTQKYSNRCGSHHQQ